MKSMDKKRLTVYLDTETYKQVSLLSRIYEWSKTKVIEKLINKGIEEEKKGNKIK
ncbi:MAG: hypothetical protein KDK54_19765 [Leptospiraceae bacterium]|nr:hypothetical protein [Leptospiraceae bacterium]